MLAANLVESILVESINDPLLPAAEHAGRFPAPAPPPRPANSSPLLPDRSRCLSSQTAPGPAPCAAPHSARWREPATPPAAALPAHGIRRPELRAISVRTRPYAPQPLQCRPAISPPRLPSCCVAQPARAAMACAQSGCKERRAAPAESTSAPIRAVIRLVVEESRPSVADIDRKNEGYENC